MSSSTSALQQQSEPGVVNVATADAAPEAFRPPPGHPRFEHIDALRAVAAMAVLTTHAAAEAQVQATSWASIVMRLNVGVTIFFLISGFLLYRPFVAARAGAPGRRVSTYLKSRALRILPAYWVALTALAIWPGLVGVFTSDAPLYYGLLQIYRPETFLAGLAPAWTLCVELSFYLLLPLWAKGAGAVARRRGFEAGLKLEAAVLAVAALAALTWHTTVQYETDRDYLANNILGLFDWFALGMALAIVSVRQEIRPSRLGEILGGRAWLWWSASVALYTVLCFLSGLPRFPTFPPPDMSVAQIAIEHVGYGLVALFLLIPAAFPGDRSGWPRTVLAWPPLAWLGLISYGLFLWHDRLIYELADGGALGLIPGSPFVSMWLVTVLISIPLGAASWYLVERPALRFKSIRPRRPRVHGE